MLAPSNYWGGGAWPPPLPTPMYYEIRCVGKSPDIFPTMYLMVIKITNIEVTYLRKIIDLKKI